MQYLFSSVFTVCFESNALIKSKENIFYTLKKTTSVTLSEHYCFNSFWQINITGNVIQSANLDLAKWRFGNDMKQKLKKNKPSAEQEPCSAQFCAVNNILNPSNSKIWKKNPI